MIATRALSFLALTSASLFAWACSGGSPGSDTFSAGAGAQGSSVSGTGGGDGLGGSVGTTSSGVNLATVGSGTTSGGACTGLVCQVHSCSGSGSTTISGTIYDPAGKNPLYGVVAYVPNGTPAPLASGASCYSCDSLYTGDPIAAAVTDANGNFTIKNAPDGADIPLVIQVGKWRRLFKLPSVAMCATTAVPSGTLTLPKNGSEGDMPNIAISTGAADTLECLLVRVGVDEAEYVPGASTAGHIHIFQGSGNNAPTTLIPAPSSMASLWDSQSDLTPYDILMLSCEGEETTGMNQQALFDYAAAGGRVFASHFHYAWLNSGPFGSQNLATWDPGPNLIGASTGVGTETTIDADVVTTLWDGAPFARGQAFQQWMQHVGALTSNGQLVIQDPRHNADLAVSNTVSQPWLTVDGSSSQAQDFTFDTPLGAPAGSQCGRVAYSDMHVGGGSNDYFNGGAVDHGVEIAPEGCMLVDLSAQEKALEFILFDLSSCVTANNTPLQPPPPPTVM